MVRLSWCNLNSIRLADIHVQSLCTPASVRRQLRTGYHKLIRGLTKNSHAVNAPFLSGRASSLLCSNSDPRTTCRKHKIAERTPATYRLPLPHQAHNNVYQITNTAASCSLLSREIGRDWCRAKIVRKQKHTQRQNKACQPGT